MPAGLPPRIYGICAVEADVVALIARAGQLTHVLKWNLAERCIESGARFRGRAYARRCDVSPDGRYLFAFLMRRGKPHTVVSRLPWVYGLSYQEEHGTWGRGEWFMTEHDKPVSWPGAPAPTTVNLNNKYTLRLCVKPNGPLFNEYRREWIEAPDCLPRAEDDVWDEQRPTVILEKTSKAPGRASLRLDRGFSSTARVQIDGYRPTYFWRERADVPWRPLVDAAWADFSHTGRFVYTTWAGEAVEVRVSGSELVTVQRHSLTDLPTDRTRAPDWARQWG